MREVTIGPCRLINADCRDVLPTLDGIDAIVTDPPYGVLDETWDLMTTRELARFTMSWLGRVTELSDTLVTFFAQEKRNVIDPLLHALFDEVRQLVWNKLGGRVSEDGMFYAYEPIYFCHPEKTWSVCEPKALEVAGLIRAARESAGLSKGGVDIAVRGKKTGLCYRWEEAACLPTPEQVEKLKSLIPLNGSFEAAYSAAMENRDKVVAMAREQASVNAGRCLDVFSVSPSHGVEGRHPTEKPLVLMERLLGVSSESGGTVLDPFMGSGTTGVACVRLGRQFIGIEKDETYFETACKRIGEAVKADRDSLFSDARGTA